MFNPACQSLVGKRARWNVWGCTYTGTIVKVISEGSLYLKGDWIVKEDKSGQTAVVIGAESKIIP